MANSNKLPIFADVKKEERFDLIATSDVRQLTETKMLKQFKLLL